VYAASVYVMVGCPQGRRHDFKSEGDKTSRAKKNLYPLHLEKWGVQFFSKWGYAGTSKQITISIEYTEICCLVVT